MGSPKTSLTMNAFFLVFTLATCFAKNLNPDHINDMSEKEFLKFFHLNPIKDPKELALREKTLKAHEAKIKKINKQYLKGKRSGLPGSMSLQIFPMTKFWYRKLD